MAKEKTASKTAPVRKETPEDKLKALNAAIELIEKKHGGDAIMKMGEGSKVHVDIIPTGCFELDFALGIGGIPRGRVIEIYGPEASGKTTTTLHIIAQAQKQGGVCAFIDAEHALDPIYATKLGVNIDELYLSQPDNGEQAVDICEALVRSGALDLIVIDSVAALTPKAEIDGTMEEYQVGAHARLMSKALRKLTAACSKANTAVIFINQIREKVGVIYGSPEVTTGGKALKFYSSVRIDIRRGEPIKNGSDLIGYATKAKVVKNKLAPPFKLAMFDILFGEGISLEGSVLDAATKQKLVQRSGAYYSYNGQRIGQGRDNARKFLKENPDVFAEIEEKLKQELAKQVHEPIVGENEPDDELDDELQFLDEDELSEED